MGVELYAKRSMFMGRECVRIGNGLMRATIDLDGGMVPELGFEREGRFLNLHWIPPFRPSTGVSWSQELHGSFWKSSLLYNIAGDFLCSPNFGSDCIAYGEKIPAHGWTANRTWKLVSLGADTSRGIAYADFLLESPVPGIPLTWARRDFMITGQSALFSTLTVNNGGATALAINIARHNTIGPPFLEQGCRISLSAETFMTARSGTEFDATGRLAMGKEFEKLSETPLRSGAVVDLSIVPGMIGATDFITGAVPDDAGLGWSCVHNKNLGLAYVCLFPGLRGLPEGEISLSFNDLWMQYGGRPFTPWAESEGSQDRSFCLGTENAVGAFANGLAFSLANPRLLGRATTVEIPAGGERTLQYATALLPLGPDLNKTGVDNVLFEAGSVILGGGKVSRKIPLSADFEIPRRLGKDMPLLLDSGGMPESLCRGHDRRNGQVW
jgi:hypothetical protein